MHHKHKQARIVMLASLQEPAQTPARMHHKHKHARNINPRFGGSLEGCGCSCRQVLEVASFVPGHVRNRGATPWSWTALCSKKNKVATPLGRTPWSGNSRLFKPGPTTPQNRRRGRHRHRPRRPRRFHRAPGRAPSWCRCRCCPGPWKPHASARSLWLFYFGPKTDFAWAGSSAAAEKRARWARRWHPTYMVRIFNLDILRLTLQFPLPLWCFLRSSRTRT
jgi:hypothetical protein